MASTNIPPQTLNSRHTVACMLEATGRFTRKQIAETLNLSTSRLGVVLNSPLGQAEVARYQEQLAGNTLKEALEALNSEVLPSIKTLAGLRDDETIDAAVRRNSAKDLMSSFFDRNPAPVSGGGPNGLNIQLDKESAELIATALNEVKSRKEIDVTPKKDKLPKKRIMSMREACKEFSPDQA